MIWQSAPPVKDETVTSSSTQSPLREGACVGAAEGDTVETKKSVTETLAITTLPVAIAAVVIADVREPSLAELAKVALTKSASSAPEDNPSSVTILIETTIDAVEDKRRSSCLRFSARRDAPHSVSLNCDASKSSVVATPLTNAASAGVS
jgi:hypothetical protein